MIQIINPIVSRGYDQAFQSLTRPWGRPLMQLIHPEQIPNRAVGSVFTSSIQFSRNRQRNQVNRLPCDGVDCPRCPASYSCAASRAGLEKPVMPWPAVTLLGLAALAVLQQLL